MLGAEGDHRRRAAVRGGHRGGIEVVRGHHAHAGKLLDMAVAIHPARKNQLAHGIEVFLTGEVAADLGDLLARDAEVRTKGPFRRGDGAAADHEIEGHATIFL
jgi:hypothetical protein